MTMAIATHERPTTARRWAARVLTAVPILMLTTSAAFKLSHAPAFVSKWTDHFGFPESALTPIGVLELVCAALYAVPRTRFVGAILVTAYLGGATVTHVRVGEPFVVPVVLGVLAWVGLTLGDRRVEASVRAIGARR